MDKRQTTPGCAGCPLSRRRFLTAASAGALGALAPAGLFQACGRAEKLKVRVVYALHAVVQPGPDWPNVGFDFQPVMDRTAAVLAKAFPGWDLTTAMAKGPEEAQKILAGDAAAPVDGYIVVQLNCWNRVVQTIAASGKPTLYVDFQYGGSGGFLVYTADFLRKKTGNLGFVASSRPEDLVAACGAFGKVKKAGRRTISGPWSPRSGARRPPGRAIPASRPTRWPSAPRPTASGR